MKKIGVLLIWSLCVCLNCNGASQDVKSIEVLLTELLKNKNYFKLQEKIRESIDILPKEKVLFYKAYCAQAFDVRHKSNEYIDTLLNNYKDALTDTIVVELLEMKSINHICNYEYKKAVDVYDLIINRYGKTCDSISITNYKNVKQLYSAISEVKPQSISKTKDSVIKARRNQFNHLMTPVKCHSISDNFIFDTGANISTISEGCALKMGLTIYESYIKVSTATDINVHTRLAVADSIYVGDILFENVVFLVAKDSDLTFPQIDYAVHGIIGFPVIHQMGEIHLRKGGTILIPKSCSYTGVHNMYLDGFNPIVTLYSENDTLLCTLDTGARKSELSKKYFDRHKDYIMSNYTLKRIERGGAGGIAEVEAYCLPQFSYAIGRQNGVLPEIEVLIHENIYNVMFDGNLGQDIITQFDEMILNFVDMYIDFK